MRLVAWLLFSLVAVTAAIYAVGCWLLGEWPPHIWRSALPDMYDGKEPYDQWAAKMEIARQIQAAMEAEDDRV